MAVKWLDEPEAHDFDAAAEYLSLVGDPDVVAKTVAALHKAEPAYQKAKDILRAARLDLLPTTNMHVKADLDKIHAASGSSRSFWCAAMRRAGRDWRSPTVITGCAQAM